MPTSLPILSRPGAVTQAIRVADVVVLGPLMIYAGAAPGTLPTWARVLLVTSGAGTMLYNAANFFDAYERTRVVTP